MAQLAHSALTPGEGFGAGSTGISVAMVAAAAGCRCAVALPDDAAAEKGALLEALGARVLRQRPVSIAHPQHFVNVARRLAAEAGVRSPSNPGPSSPNVSIARPQHQSRRRAAAGRGGGRAQPRKPWTWRPRKPWTRRPRKSWTWQP